MPYENNNFNRGNYNNNRGGNFPKYSGNVGKKADKNDTNTNGILLKNEKAGKFLRVGYWNGTMKTDIGTIQPGQPIDSTTIQNAQTFGHVFSFGAMCELYDICVEIEDEVKSTGSFKPMAVVAGQKKDTILEISDGSNIGMPAGIYFVLYKGVDAGKRTNTYDYYPFDVSVVLKDYNRQTGEADMVAKRLGDFKKFKVVLKESMKAFTNAQAHVIKEVNKGHNKNIFAALNAIGKSLNVDINESVMNATTNRTNGKTSYNRNNNYQRQSQGGQWNNAQAAISNEPVDINMSAATLQQVDISELMA